MRNYFSALILLISIAFVAQAQKPVVYEHDFIVKTGQQSPEFIVKEAGGKTYKLSDLRGKVVMLQFTASWCSVCRTEMPFIEKDIWQAGKSKDLAVIGIDRDEPLEKVSKFRKDIGISYPLALDPGAEIYQLFALKESGVTRNVIIDRSGKIIYLTRLFEKEEFDKMKEVIFSELAKK
jgi:peroxiredoxin